MYVEYEYLYQFASGMQSGSNPSKDRGFREFEGHVFDLFRKIKSQNIRSVSYTHLDVYKRQLQVYRNDFSY